MNVIGIAAADAPVWEVINIPCDIPLTSVILNIA